MTVELTPESERHVRDLLGRGTYADESQAVEAAIRLLHTRKAQVEEVREKLAVAAEDIRAGRVRELTADEIMAELRTHVAAHL